MIFFSAYALFVPIHYNSNHNIAIFKFNFHRKIFNYFLQNLQITFSSSWAHNLLDFYKLAATTSKNNNQRLLSKKKIYCEYI